MEHLAKRVLTLQEFLPERQGVDSKQEHYCNICRETGTERFVSLKRCGHIFHGHCILQWVLDEDASCPTCRIRLHDQPIISCAFCGSRDVEIQIQSHVSLPCQRLFCHVCEVFSAIK